MSEKIDRLVAYIERWTANHPRRNATMLSRLSGVAYPTLRRIMLKECVPTLDNALALLNTIASLPETIDYFDDNVCIQDFCSRLASYKERSSDPDVILRLMKRESFWIVTLALTVGATAARVEKLLGSFGVAEFQSMIDEGYVHEESSGVYRTNAKALTEYIDSIRVSDEVLRHIAEVPTHQGDLKRFLTFNVSTDAFKQMKGHVFDCYQQLERVARNNPGNVVVAGSLTMLRIFDEEGLQRTTL